jgi:hypothetical protein
MIKSLININVQVIQAAQVGDDKIRTAVVSHWKHLRSKYSRGKDVQEHKGVKMAFYMSNRRHATQVVSLLKPDCNGVFYTYSFLRPETLNLVTQNNQRISHIRFQLDLYIFFSLPVLPIIAVV